MFSCRPQFAVRRVPLRFALLLAVAGCSSPAATPTRTGASATTTSGEVTVVSAERTGGGGEGYSAPSVDTVGRYADSAELDSVAPEAAPSPARYDGASTGGAPARAEAMGAAREEGRRASSEAYASDSPATPARGAGPVDVTVTVTVEESEIAIPDPMPTPQQQVAPQSRVLTAATVGDTDRRGNYLEYVNRRPFEAQRAGFDVSRRVRFRVVDSHGRPFRGAQISLGGQGGQVDGTTMADGYWDYFPGVLGDVGSEVQATVTAAGVRAQVAARIPMAGDGQDVVFRMQGVMATAPQRLDLAFLIDVTGSMEDELRYVNAEVADIVGRIHAASPEVAVRVGATFYRDRGDREPIQEIRFTSDIQGFARTMLSIRADGGGDYPEDLNSGLAAAFGRQSWSEGDAVRVMVVIADAPPQHYQSSYTYVQAMRDASRLGIRLLPVAASGADREVEFLFRAMATVTGAPYTYLTDESGVGNPHMEADTDRVAVEYWNDQLTRLVTEDLRGAGMHELIPN